MVVHTREDLTDDGIDVGNVHLTVTIHVTANGFDSTFLDKLHRNGRSVGLVNVGGREKTLFGKDLNAQGYDALAILCPARYP